MKLSRPWMKTLLAVAETVGLALIFLATVISIGLEVWHMVEALKVELADLLLLFLFMEVLAMIGIFHESHRVPVRFPIYIAIVALARYLVLGAKSLEPLSMLAVGATVLILAAGVLVIRYGHIKFPYGEKDC